MDYFEFNAALHRGRDVKMRATSSLDLDTQGISRLADYIRSCLPRPREVVREAMTCTVDPARSDSDETVEALVVRDVKATLNTAEALALAAVYRARARRLALDKQEPSQHGR